MRARTGSLVQGDVIGLVALDRILRFLLAGVMDVTFVVHILRVHLHNSTADAPGLRVPAHVIANLEHLFHGATSARPIAQMLKYISCATGGRADDRPSSPPILSIRLPGI